MQFNQSGKKKPRISVWKLDSLSERGKTKRTDRSILGDQKSHQPTDYFSPNLRIFKNVGTFDRTSVLSPCRMIIFLKPKMNALFFGTLESQGGLTLGLMIAGLLRRLLPFQVKNSDTLQISLYCTTTMRCTRSTNNKRAEAYMETCFIFLIV